MDRRTPMKDLTIERLPADKITLIASQRKKEEAYWLDTFSGPFNRLAFPYDSPNPKSGPVEKETVPIQFSSSIVSRLNDVTQNSDTRLNVILMTTLAVLIYKYTSIQDFTIGTAVNKQDADHELINRVLPVRTPVISYITFKQLILQVGQRIFEAARHQNYPMERLVEKLNLRPSGSQDFPLFDTAIILENIHEEYYLGHIHFNTLFYFLHSGDSLRGVLKYNPSLYHPGTAAAIARHFSQLLDTALHNLDVPVSDISMLSPDEARQIVEQFNDTEQPYPGGKTIDQCFEACAAEAPGQIAAVYQNQRLTYGALNASANRLANLLRARGIAACDTVGILIDHSLEMITGILAILKSGASYVPIEPKLPHSRVMTMLQECQARVLLTKTHLFPPPGQAIAQSDLLDIVYLDDIDTLTAGQSEENLQAVNRPSDLAYIIFTSGSTGTPKGVMLEHKSLINLCYWHNHQYRVTASDHAAKYAGFGFDASVWEIFPYLLAGATLYIIDDAIKMEMSRLNDYFEEHHMTIAFLPTQVCEQFMRLDNRSLRILLTGGDKLKTFSRKNYLLVNNYGPTENTVVATCFPVDKAYSNIPIGKPVSNTRIYILDHGRNLVPVGVAGELYIGGASVARGYLNNQELTQEKFIASSFFPGDRLYRTGDLGKWMDDGNIQFLGRVDNQVKIRSYRIELGEIESCLLSHQSVQDTVVIDRKDDQGNNYLCAYIVAAPLTGEKSTASESPAEVEILKDFLVQHLPDYMIPAFFVPVAAIPLTPNGKIDRAALPKPDLSVGSEYIPPENKVEEVMCGIWSSVLGLDKVGVCDDYFSLGGDSIKSIQIQAKMNNYRYLLDVKDIFQYPTIRQLAARLQTRSTTTAQSPVVGPVPLTPIQEEFFREDTGLNHFNQSVMLQSKIRLDEESVRAVFNQLQQHHDALRMIYKKEGDGFIQINQDIDFPLALEVHDLSSISGAEDKQLEIANEIQASIDLENGPLMKIALFHRVDNDRLLIVIHHLVVDGISWRILMEDIELLVKKHIHGQDVELPPKSSSFKQWSEKIQHYANSTSLLQQIPYWQTYEQLTISAIPRDFDGDFYLKDAQQLSFSLDPGQTRELLTRVNQAYNTEINDILLTALGLAMNQTFSVSGLLLTLEGHGRENIIRDVDISRTVGWFTSTYPVYLDMSYTSDMSRQIKEVKESLSKVLDKGIGFGILKYLTAPENKPGLSMDYRSTIQFNYLGQFDTDIDQMSSFDMSPESCGDTMSLERLSPCDFSVSGIITGGKLSLSITYSTKQYKKATVQSLINAYQDQLNLLIAHCTAAEKVHYTPGDFTYKQLSIPQVDELTAEYDIDDIYPLSPMQEGMLFHWLENPNSSAYLQQVSYRFRGNLLQEVVETSLNELFKRYDIFRTRFLTGMDQRPLQVVLKKQCIDFTYIDIRQNTESEQHRTMAQYKANDHNTPFSLRDDVLMRVALFQLSGDQFEVLWTFHHILMDGWSLGIISKEFFDIYSRIIRGASPLMPAVQPYKAYIQWIENRTRTRSGDYWQEYLEGYREKAALPKNKNKANKDECKNQEMCIRLNDLDTQRLSRLAARAQVTVNSVVQAVWGLLLARYNSTDDVVFGTVVSGRPSQLQGVESMVGLFINTIPLRIAFDHTTTFAALFKKVQHDFIHSEPHHYVSLAEIQAKTILKHELLDHIIGFENYPVARILGEISHHQEHSFHMEFSDFETVEESNYGFSIVVIPNDQLSIKFRYNSYEYDRDLVIRVKDYMENILRRLIDDDDNILNLPVVSAEFMPEHEKRQLLDLFNDTTIDFPAHKTVAQLFCQQAERTPEFAALVWQETVLSYRELNRQAGLLADRLRIRGVRPGAIVAMLMERGPEMIVSMLGILNARGAYLPIKPQYPVNRVKRMLKDSGAAVLLTRTRDMAGKSFTLLQDLDHVHHPVTLSPSRPSISDFDSLSIPDRSLVDYEKYNQHIGLMMVKNSMSLQASRGCPFNCAYCHKIWPKAHYMRSAENIFKEVKLYYDMGVRRFSFVDDVFNLNVKNSTRFFQLIIENKLDVQLFFGLRGDILTKEYIDLMVQAGTTRMALALETASPRLQKLIKKDLNLDKFKKNLEYIAQHYPQVILELNTMHGLPTESPEEAQMTLDFIKSIKWLDFPYINILKIYPNTDMEQLAVEYGISRQAIEASADLAYHELPETLPFDKSFTLEYQTRFLDEYFLDKVRLLHVLPYQMKVLTRQELVRKYDSYLPADIQDLDDLLAFLKISPDQLDSCEFLPEHHYLVPELNEKLRTAFPAPAPGDHALRVLLLDLSQYFSDDANMLYDLVEPPIGLMYLMTYLKGQLGQSVNGKIAKSRIDFNDYDRLKVLLDEFKPNVIGIRTLTFFKNFFHQTAAVIRQWGFDGPLVAGGPYATSDYQSILQDKNIDLVVMGEGEITFSELIARVIENNGQMPADTVLKSIPGLAFIPGRTNQAIHFARDILMTDMLDLKTHSADSSQISLTETDFPNGSPQDLAYIIYTSGSTGFPKGVMIENRSVVNVVSWFARSYHVQPGTHVMSLTDYTFDASVNQVFGTLLHGGTLHLISEDRLADIPGLRQYIKDNHIHILNYVPTFFNELLANLPRLKDVRAVLSGGERLDDVIKGAILEKGYDLYNQYGPTESTIDALVARCSEDSVTLGRPISNVQVYIIGKDKKLSPMWVSGELYVGGAGLARGYLNRPQLTKERFVSIDELGRLYRSGDLARWLPNGTVEFLGRIDHQVKIRGYRIELGEIESQLLGSGKVKETVVLAKDTEKGGKFLCAYFVASDGQDTEPDAVELKEYLAQHLPAHMVPSDFIQMDKFPVTSGGKTDRNSLLAASPVVKDGGDAPHNRTERRLAEIWSEVLDIPTHEIGVNANFFELGGHSLKASQVASKINKEMDVKVPITDIFVKPTIAQLADCIKDAEKEMFAAIRPVPKQDYYPLSSAQKRLYILQQMDRHSISYNMPDAFYLDEIVDIARLEEVFRQLIQRHESFRTSFDVVDGEPVQIIHEQAVFNFEYYAETIDFKRFVRPFDLTRSPLLRVGVVSIGSGTNGGGKKMMLIDMHHIISDGISHEILRAEFDQLMRGEELLELRLQYKDYAHWQNSPEQQKKVEKQEVFWLETLSGELPVLDLPVDFPRPVSRSFEGGSVPFTLDQFRTEGLKKIVVETGATLYMVLLAIYSILLAKISGQDDIIVGSPIAARNHEDLRKIIGMFLNTLAMRNFPGSKKTFMSFLSEVRERTLDAFDNQDYPFENIVEKLDLPRDPSRNPIFDVMFNLIGQKELNQSPAPTETLESQEFKVNSAKFDLNLRAIDYGRQVYLNLEYSSALFKAQTIMRFTGYFLNIVDAVINQPGITLANIEIIPGAEKDKKLCYFNEDLQESFDIPTIQEKLNHSFNRFANNVALEYGDTSIKYCELQQKSIAISKRLQETGMQKGQAIGIYMENKVDFIASIIAVLNSGGIFVPIDTALPRNRVEQMIGSADIRIFLTGGKYKEILSKQIGKERAAVLLSVEVCVSPSADAPARTLRSEPLSPVQYHLEDKVYIYYTSGSTGTPNAIVGRNESLVQFILWQIDTFAIDHTCRVSQLSAIGFDAFLRDIFVPLFTGGTVCIPQSAGVVMDQRKLAAWLDHSRVKLIHCVPSLFRHIFSSQLTASYFKHLEFVLMSGEQINPGDLKRWYEVFDDRIQLVNFYGPTETTMIKTFHFIQQKDLLRPRIPAGVPLRGTRVIIVDKDMNVCDQGIAGEIYIRTPYTTYGYLGNPRLNEQRFITNPFSENDNDILYKTGDLGRELENGEIEILGRIDRQVKVRGVRIDPGEIECYLLKMEDVKEALVVERSDSEEGSYLCAYIVPYSHSDGSQHILDASAVKKALAKNLPTHAIPMYITVLEKLPLSANGKVDRQALPAPGIVSTAAYVPPANPVEEQLVNIWSEVLNRPAQSISVQANFFNSGGHSLKAAVLADKIHKTMDIELLLTEIFRGPTVREMADLITAVHSRSQHSETSNLKNVKREEVVI